MSAVFAVYCKCSIGTAECLTHAWPTDLNIRHFLICKTLSFVCMLFMFWQLSLCWFLTCDYSIYCIILFCIKNFLIMHTLTNFFPCTVQTILIYLLIAKRYTAYLSWCQFVNLIIYLLIGVLKYDQWCNHYIKWLKYGKKNG